jgi:hypothetical protein
MRAVVISRRESQGRDLGCRNSALSPGPLRMRAVVISRRESQDRDLGCLISALSPGLG